MQNLGQLNDWASLLAGEQIVVPVTASQWVTIKVNAPHDAAFYYWPLASDGTYGKKEPGTFLAVVKGLDEVRFMTPVDVVIECDAEVMICTNAGVEKRPDDAGESFTRIVERRSVSPDVAAVVARANANQRAMMRQMQQILENQERVFASRENAAAVKEGQSDEHTATGGGDGDKASGAGRSSSDGRASSEKAAGGGEGDGSSA